MMHGMVDSTQNTYRFLEGINLHIIIHLKLVVKRVEKHIADKRYQHII